MIDIYDWPHESSGLTDRELLNLYGLLSPGRTERLIDRAEILDKLEGVTHDCLDDAVANYPEEDCLQDIIEELRSIAKDAEPQELLDLAERLEQWQEDQSRASEYGVSVIRSYQTTVGDLP